MTTPFYTNGELTAINIEPNEKTVHIGILIVPPHSQEIQTINNMSFHLTSDLINKSSIKVALENEFELAEK